MILMSVENRVNEDNDLHILPAFQDWLKKQANKPDTTYTQKSVYLEVLAKFNALIQERQSDAKPIYNLIDEGNAEKAQELLDLFTAKWGTSDREALRMQLFIHVL